MDQGKAISPGDKLSAGHFRGRRRGAPEMSLRGGCLKAAACLVLSLFFFQAASDFPACAEEISFEASVQDNRVPMGTGVALSLKVQGEKDVEPPQLPDIEGFETRYTGPTTHVSVINGVYSKAKIFNYVLLPLKEGKHTIPSFELTLKGQVYRTQPIDIEILPAGQPGSSGSAQPGGAVDLSSRIKLHLLVSRTECYVNETLPVVLKLYYQELPLQDITMPEFKNEGFVVGDYAQPRQYEETMDGVKYHVVEFRTSISPLRTGQLQVGPVVINANMLYKIDTGRNSGGNKIFDDDFFSGFFSSYQKRPLTISSRPFELKVKPIPDEGRPADFSGAVGHFDLQVEVGPVEVRAGDPVTLKATVFGSGSLKNIRMPQVVSEGYKVYDPQIKEEGGRKIMEQVLIPTRPDVKSIPALSFNYFDPVRGQYMTVTRGPFPVRVTAPEPGQEFQAVGYANARALPLNEDLGRDIVFIKDQLGRVQDSRGSLSRALPFYFVLVLFLNLWGIFFGIYLYRQRLLTDTAFARRQRAPKAARAAWALADQAASAGQTKAFYEALEQGLRAFLSDALSLPLGEAFGERAYEEMRLERVPDGIIARLRALEDKIELARFASAVSSADEMHRSLEEAKAVTRAVEDIL